MKIVTFIKILTKVLIDKDEWSRFFLAEKLFNAIYPKMRIQEFSNIMFEDKKFIEYYQRFQTDNNHSFDRKYNLNNLMNLVSYLDGNLAECGVYLGATAYLIAQKNTHETIYLFDTFGGLSKPNTDIDGTYWQEGDLNASLDLVKENLKIFPNIIYMQGLIPDRFNEINTVKFKFVHIDVDLYEPTRDSLECFYSKMVIGGIILCDDYGFSSCPGAKKAFDDFFLDKKEVIAQLSSGQAFIIKL